LWSSPLSWSWRFCSFLSTLSNELEDDFIVLSAASAPLVLSGSLSFEAVFRNRLPTSKGTLAFDGSGGCVMTVQIFSSSCTGGNGNSIPSVRDSNSSDECSELSFLEDKYLVALIREKGPDLGLFPLTGLIAIVSVAVKFKIGSLWKSRSLRMDSLR